MKREVFDVVDLPVGRKALKSRYLLKLKKMAELNEVQGKVSGTRMWSV